MRNVITSVSMILNSNNYAKRADRLRKHEENGTLSTARRRFQNTKGHFKPKADSK